MDRDNVKKFAMASFAMKATGAYLTVRLLVSYSNRNSPLFRLLSLNTNLRTASTLARTETFHSTDLSIPDHTWLFFNI
jgi:hypothetical protein